MKKTIKKLLKVIENFKRTGGITKEDHHAIKRAKRKMRKK